MSLTFPVIDPVVVKIGPLMIRWYALAYLAGFLVGWVYALRLARRYGDNLITRQHIDDFMMWAVIGVIAGGRIGYVLFYNFPYFLSQPLHIFYVWEGGMSFHGGATGVVLAIIGYAIANKLPLFRLADIVCACVPIGLFFGRLANFINAELYGRVTTHPFGMVFPGTDGQPRHPSQLYEAVSEGLLLFTILAIMMMVPGIRNRAGLVSAVFLIGYGICRFLIEFVREPDVQLGTLSFGLTMGQSLCLPMIFGGVMVWLIARRVDAKR